MVKLPINAGDDPVIPPIQFTEEEMAETSMYLRALEMCISYVPTVHMVRLSDEEISKYTTRKLEDNEK